MSAGQGKDVRLIRRRRGPAVAGSALVLSFALAVALASSSTAQVTRPVISGDPIVGETLTSSSAGVYKWQRCNPAVATCDPNAPHGDADWPDIPGADEQTYTIPPADHGFLIRVRAKGTSVGTKFAASLPVGPVTGGANHGISFLAEPVDGVVRVNTPGPGGFTILTGPTELPVKTIINVKKGTILITAATGGFGSDALGPPIEFFGGLFKFKQTPAVNSPGVAKLRGKLHCPGTGQGGKSGAAAGEGPLAGVARHRKRRLWGSGRGKYRTRGSGGTGSVRGTKFLTKDTCKGTVFSVPKKQDHVPAGITVFDFGEKKKIKLGPGKKYLATN